MVWSKTFKTVAGVLLGGFLSFTFASAEVIRPFEIRHQININGNIVYTGNTLMRPKGVSKPPLDMNNDKEQMEFIDVDDDPATNKSSRALLDIRADSQVVFAALYWGGRLANVEEGKKLLFQVPGGKYEEVNAQWIASPERNNYYAAYADVTEQVKKGKRGIYTVANVGAQTGRDRFAGWSLVVIEANDVFPFRNITLYDGYASIPNQVDIKVEGFVAPRFGSFNASLGVVAYEGDAGHDGDKFLFNGEALSDSITPANNFFSSRFHRNDKLFTQREPNNVNLMGFDIAQMDVTGKVKNGDTSASLSFATDRDWYQPTAVSFMTDFNIDVTMQMHLEYKGVLTPQSEVTVTAELHNNGKQGYDSVEAFLPIPEQTEYVLGSTSLDWMPLTDTADGDYATLEEKRMAIRLPKIRSGETKIVRYKLKLGNLTKPIALQHVATLVVPELGSRATLLSDADLTQPGTQPAWLYPMTLSAPASVKEGGRFDNSLHTDFDAGDALLVYLHDGTSIKMGAAKQEASLAAQAPQNDIYQTHLQLGNYIEKIDGIVAAHPVIMRGSEQTPLSVAVEDVNDTTTLKLIAQNLFEGERGALLQAQLSAPAQSEMTLRLDGGEVMKIAPGQTQTQLLIPVRPDDVYLNPDHLLRKVVAVEGGGFENVDINDAHIDIAVKDTITPVYLTLSASDSVYEGGEIQYTATVSQTPATTLTITLDNGHDVVITPGQTSGQITVAAPPNNVYISTETLTVKVVKTTGGNFESLVSAEGGSGMVARTHIKDFIDTTSVTLTTGDVNETDGKVRFTATLGAAAQGAARVYLDVGEVIEIAAGKTSGFTDIPIAANDVYQNPYTVRRTVKQVEGGGFESLEYHDVGAVALVKDVTDPVYLDMSADASANEGEAVSYTATLTHPPKTDLTLSLSNGGSLTVEAGKKVGHLQMVPVSNDSYKSAHDLAVFIAGQKGGMFESLVIRQGGEAKPVITAIRDVIDTTTVTLLSADVSENDENLVFTAILSNPAQTPVKIKLDGGEEIAIAPNESSGFTVVKKSPPDVYVNAAAVNRAVTSLEGGNFEAVDYSTAKAHAWVADVIDTTTLHISAEPVVKEGGVIHFTAQVDYPPQNDLVLELDNGAVIKIPAGATQGAAQINAPGNNPYRSTQTLQVGLKASSGGNYERLMVAAGGKESQIRVVVEDDPDTTTLTLATKNVTEGAEAIVFEATLSNPAQTPVRIGLDGGEEILIEQGKTSGKVGIPVHKNDVYLGEPVVARKAMSLEGGNFEHVEIKDAYAQGQVKDVADPVHLSLQADPSVKEGGRITYKASVDHAPQSDLTVTLNNGLVMTIPQGSLLVQASLDAPADDVYVNAHDYPVWVTKADGGNYEQLEIGNGNLQTAAVTHIEDVPDTVWVELSAQDAPEGNSGMRFIAHLSMPTATPMTLTFDGGETITIPAGDTAGLLLVPTPANDVYISPQTLARKVVSIKGGGFESVSLDSAAAQAQVYDTLDPVSLTLSAPAEAEEGSVVSYAVKLSHAPKTALTVNLSNGTHITVEPGATEGTVTFQPTIDTVYDETRESLVSVYGTSGGAFENLQLANATSAAPIATRIRNVITPVALSLQAHMVNEEEAGLLVTAMLAAPAATAATAYLEGGEKIAIAAGSRIGSVLLPLRPNDPYINPQTLTYKVVKFEQGGFEQVDFSAAVVSVALIDTITPAVLKVGVAGSTTVSGEVIYTATLNYPAHIGMAVMLGNGVRIPILAGQSAGTLSFTPPEGSREQALQVHVARVIGGGFERITVE